MPLGEWCKFCSNSKKHYMQKNLMFKAGVFLVRTPIVGNIFCFAEFFADSTVTKANIKTNELKTGAC